MHANCVLVSCDMVGEKRRDDDKRSIGDKRGIGEKRLVGHKYSW